MRRLSSLVSAAAVLLVAIPAFAGEPTAEERTVARSLFEEGRALVKDGKYAEACPKLEESERLAPGMGTLFNLADCFEKMGRTASAWAAFSEVGDLARVAGQGDRESVARDRAAALKPKLVYWKLHLAGAPPAGLALTVDGRAVSNAMLDSELPVDPGTHAVRATAPGKRASETEARIDGSVHTTPVELPAFVDAPEVAPPSPTPAALPAPLPVAPAAPAETGAREWQKPVAIVAGGVALVALGVGAAFGASAGSKWSDAQATCVGSVCDAKGYESWESARSSATVSTVLVSTGAVVAVGAVVLWLTAPSSKSPTGAAGTFARWGTF